jgi:hypothetical protein
VFLPNPQPSRRVRDPSISLTIVTHLSSFTEGRSTPHHPSPGTVSAAVLTAFIVDNNHFAVPGQLVQRQDKELGSS